MYIRFQWSLDVTTAAAKIQMIVDNFIGSGDSQNWSFVNSKNTLFMAVKIFLPHKFIDSQWVDKSVKLSNCPPFDHSVYPLLIAKGDLGAHLLTHFREDRKVHNAAEFRFWSIGSKLFTIGTSMECITRADYLIGRVLKITKWSFNKKHIPRWLLISNYLFMSQ